MRIWTIWNKSEKKGEEEEKQTSKFCLCGNKENKVKNNCVSLFKQNTEFINGSNSVPYEENRNHIPQSN